MTPIGAPDFGANPSTNPTAPSFDTGEDTTRILMGGGSQARSGRWIFATGFEEGATPFMQSSATGTGGEAAIKTDLTYQGVGAFSLQAGSAVNNISYLQKTFLYPSSRYGLEIMFSRNYALDSELSFTIMGGGKGPDKSKFRTGKIVLVITTTPSAILYHDVNGSRTQIADVSSYSAGNPYLWHYFKMVFDFDTNKIAVIKFDDLILYPDLSGYEFSGSTVTTSIEIRNTNKYAGVNPDFYIDNLIITADEP